ncbi:hypothetical protein GCM10027294_31800 [Marinactinospora endophytica]
MSPTPPPEAGDAAPIVTVIAPMTIPMVSTRRSSMTPTFFTDTAPFQTMPHDAGPITHSDEVDAFICAR